ncbi:MAG: hypothetical protein KF798_04620 [Candidatus Paracaedibacteraceae bacterium]|nr:hypothetical protein [Candidatus Paracaedibacteraceae bacterium]
MVKFILGMLSSILFLQAQDATYYPAASYSNDRVREIFQGVEFTDPNVSIVEIKQYRNRGTMILEFGDVAQLEDLLDQQVAVSAHRLYFSYVPGRKSISYGDDSVLQAAFKVIGVEGVKARGILKGVDRRTIYVPIQSEFGKILGNFGEITSHVGLPVKAVVKFFYDSNRDVVFSRRTADASDLYASALDDIKGRNNRDHKIEFDNTHLNLWAHSDSDITYRVHQVVSSQSDIIAIASSLLQLKTYLKETKLHNPIRLLMPDHQIGVYSGRALTLSTEVLIKSSSDLLILGSFYDRNSFLRIKSGTNLYGSFDAVAAGLFFAARTNLTLAEVSQGSELIFYNQLSPALYAHFINYLEQLNFIAPEDGQELVKSKSDGVSYNQILSQRHARTFAKFLFPGLFEDDQS